MASQTEIVVRFAGEGGQGVVTAAEMLARAAESRSSDKPAPLSGVFCLYPI